MRIYKIIFLIIFLSYTDGILAQENTTLSYINKYKGIAVKEMHRSQIPASIKLAQAILESGSGQSKLAKKANNQGDLLKTSQHKQGSDLQLQRHID